MSEKKLFYQQICEEEENLQETLAALQVLKAKYALNGDAITKDDGVKKVKVFSGEKTPFEKADDVYKVDDIYGGPAEYYTNMSQKDKSHYALNQIKKGTAEDVTRVLHKIDDSISVDEAKKFVPFMLSKLFKTGVIGARKQGYKNIYFVFKE